MKAAFRDFSMFFILFLNCGLSFASEGLCLSDDQTSNSDSTEATKCQALLQSGLQQVTSSVVEVHAEESDAAAPEPTKAPKTAPKAKEEAMKPILETDSPRMEEAMAPEAPAKEDAVAPVAKGDDYFHSDFPFDDPVSQRLGGQSGGYKHDETWEKDYPWDENRGLPNKLQADSYSRKVIKAHSASVTASKSMPTETTKVEPKPTPTVEKAAPVQTAAKATTAAPKATTGKPTAEPTAKPVDKAKMSTEGLDGPIQISRTVAR